MRRLAVLSITLFLPFLLGLWGCSWSASNKPSILIIAVESLGSDQFYCGVSDAEYEDGLGLFCADGVRFTHAYAPSPMSQATLTSIFTGLYPKDTGVWHNGRQYLPEKFQTVAEVAFRSGYRTSFFSGGPPIWRKSGLDQGFELFEDNIAVSPRELYRPVNKSFELFLNWLVESSDGRPFFTTIYLPDLQFPRSITVNDAGQERARGHDSQLKEISESLAPLYQQMKKMNLWDNSHVFLVGLNGSTLPSRESDIDPMNLRSENSQVVLFVKPARKTRDEGIGWSIDANVSLVDVGATLYDLLGSPENISSNDSQMDVSSLKKALVKPQVDWNRDRYILLESAWPVWRGISGTRVAVRQNNMLFVHDITPLIYNSLTDQFENQPIRVQDPTIRNFVEDSYRFFSARGLRPWEGMSSGLIQKLRLYQKYSVTEKKDRALTEEFAHLIQQRPWDKQIVGWLARFIIKIQDWESLAKIGKEQSNSVWTYLARRRQGETPPPPSDPCWAWIGKKNPNPKDIGNCNDSEVVLFFEWVRAVDTGKKKSAQDRFLRLYSLRQLDEIISDNNFQNGLVWDAAVDIPAAPRTINLILLLSEFKGYKLIIEE